MALTIGGEKRIGTSRMVIGLFPRPSSPESYALGQNVNPVFGIEMVTLLFLGAIGWAIGRWRTRHERGKHAALHRVSQRRRSGE